MRWVLMIKKSECTNCHRVRHHVGYYIFSSSFCGFCGSLAFGLNKLTTEWWKAINPRTGEYYEYE